MERLLHRGELPDTGELPDDLHDTGELPSDLHNTGELPIDLHDTGEVPNALSITANTLLRVQAFPARFLTTLTLRMRVRAAKISD